MALVGTLAACEGPSGLLLVNLRTDLEVPEEVAMVRTEVRGADGARLEVREALEPGVDWLHGAAVAELYHLPLGLTELTVELLSPEGEPVVARPVSVDLRGAQAVTIGLGRSCLGVRCSETEPACAGDRCVSDRCSEQTPQACGRSECEAPEDCGAAASSCARVACVHGACLAAPDDAWCAPGERCDLGRGCVSEGFAVERARFDDLDDAWTFNGEASIREGALVVGAGGEAPDSAFLTEPLPLTPWTDLTVEFTAELGGSDGLALVLQADPRMERALGGPGGALGYGGSDPDERIAPSVAVELDTFSNSFDDDDNHVAISLDGGVASPLAASELPFRLVSGPARVRLEYRSADTRLLVYVFQGETPPNEPTLRATVDLASLSPSFRLGFTASRNDQRVTSLAARARLGPSPP